ncbi:MAG: STAS domain-containing protein [Ignavibacteriaceae bacterium]|nr:STAS domain-containing protein [Ignavibacteriaceae bacterium]
MPEDFELVIVKGVRTVVVNLTRATIKEAKILKSIIEGQIIIGIRKLAIDISQCEFIDSSFIGSLVIGQKRMEENGGKIMLINPVNLDKDLFHVTNTLRIFEIYQTREEAVESTSETKLGESKPSFDSMLTAHPYPSIINEQS